MATQDDKRAGKTSGRPRRKVEETTAVFPVSVHQPQQLARRMVLAQITGPGAPFDLPLPPSDYVIGRSTTADFTIDSPELSRRHVRLEYDGGEFTCTDLDSQNGLYLNGIEVHACVLRNGDTIQLGNVSFIFREAGG